MIKRFFHRSKEAHNIQSDRLEAADVVKALPTLEEAASSVESQPIFFTHIPKTAGTSFRKAAEEYFGLDSVLYDYALSSSETSDLVKKWVYQQKDFLNLQAAFSELGVQFLSGHVPVGKYVHLLGVRRAVTVLRDPIQRVISEYHHFVRHNNYEGDLPSFYRKAQFINRQFKMLKDTPLNALGFVGLTEEYESSLAQINAVYGLDIQPQVLNQGRESGQQAYEMPAEQLQEMQQLNKQDIALYQKAVELYQQRYELFLQKKPYVHGVVEQLSPKSISGWAWSAQGNQPVTVDVLVDGEKVGSAQGRDLRPGLLRLSPPRLGYVGFHFDFKKPLKAGVEVSVAVAETGQILGVQKVGAT